MTTEIIIDKLINAIENRDAETVGSLLAEDIKFENVPNNNTIHGRIAAQEQFANFFAATSSIHWDIERKVFSGNVAVIERKNRINFQNKDIVLPMVSIIEINNNKVSVFKDYFDSQTFTKQMES